MRFQYLEPKTVKEACSLLSKYDGKSMVIAGGTDLMVKIKNKALGPEYVIELEGIPKLDYIKFTKKNGLAIGALTKICSVENSLVVKDNYPVLAYAAGMMGSMAIRNMATIGGNLCNAAPSAENAPGLLCFEAQLKIVGPKGERVNPITEFFVGPGKTALRKGEILVEIQVPPPKPGTNAIYFKHSPRGSIDLAIVGVAVVATFDGDVVKDIKIGLGAVAPTPIRAVEAEAAVKGKKLTEALIEKCAVTAAGEAKPISDVRGSAEYRKEMVAVYTRRALKSFISKRESIKTTGASP